MLDKFTQIKIVVSRYGRLIVDASRMEVFDLAVLHNFGLQKGGQVGMFVLDVVAVLNWARYDRLFTDGNLDPVFFSVFNDYPDVALQKGAEGLGKCIGWIFALQRCLCTSV